MLVVRLLPVRLRRLFLDLRRRQDFFLGITRLYRAHRPASYPIGSLSDRVVHRLIGLGAYRAYDTGRRVENALRALARR